MAVSTSSQPASLLSHALDHPGTIFCRKFKLCCHKQRKKHCRHYLSHIILELLHSLRFSIFVRFLKCTMYECTYSHIYIRCRKAILTWLSNRSKMVHHAENVSSCIRHNVFDFQKMVISEVLFAQATHLRV